jgi:hypothetical protein
MIKSINSSSEWFAVGGNRPYIPPPLERFQYPDNPHDGQMIYNFSLQEVMVYVGGVWMPALGNANIGSHYNLDCLLYWVRDRMSAEERLDELCEKYPALAEAREQFEAMKALVNEHER